MEGKPKQSEETQPITSFGKTEEAGGTVTLHLLHIFLFLNGQIIEKKWEYSETVRQLFMYFNL
jgi:hypothetical protein